jgi:hypothetical protein
MFFPRISMNVQYNKDAATTYQLPIPANERENSKNKKLRRFFFLHKRQRYENGERICHGVNVNFVYVSLLKAEDNQ